MRDRAFRRRHIPQASDQVIQQEVIREFIPGDLDVDELTEAIRMLLAPAHAARIDAPRRRNPDLLSSRRRGTHVVGAATP